MYNHDPSSVTAADLQNPRIDAETLRHIAVVRPDLRQVILQHPNCHGELANFIYELPVDAPPAPPHLQPYPEPYQSSGHYQASPYAYGYTVPRPLAPEDAKLWGVLMHVGNMFLGCIVPLIIWLILRDRSETLNQQGRAALNWGISYLIYLLASSILMVVLIGYVISPVIMILDLVFCIIAAVKAGSRQAWRYPLSIPFLDVRV